MTKAEYLAARRSGVPCFIFVKQDVRRDHRAARFITREQRRCVTKQFANRTELRGQVADAIRGFIMGRLRIRPSVAVDTRTRSSSQNGDAGSQRRPESALSPDGSFPTLGSAARAAMPREVLAELRRAKALARTGHAGQAFRLILDLSTQEERARRCASALHLVEEARKFPTSGQVGDAERAWLLNVEAGSRSHLGQRAEAIRLYEQVYAVGVRVRDKALASTALQNLGIQAYLDGKPKLAVRYCQSAIRTKLALGDAYATAQILLNVAYPLEALGGASRARDFLRWAEPLIRSIRVSDLVVSLHSSLGSLAARLGLFDDADRNLQRALRLSRRTPEQSHRTTIILQNLGSLECDRQRPARSLPWLDEAIKLSSEVDAPREIEILRRTRAIALHALGRDRQSALEFEAAARLADRVGDRALVAENIANQGALLLQTGDPERGVSLLHKALDEFTLSGDSRWQTRVLQNLAVARERAGDVAGALTHLEQAVRLMPRNDGATRAGLLHSMGRLALLKGDHAGALKAFEQELRCYPTASARELALRAAMIGAILSTYGRSGDSLPFFQSSITAFAKLSEHDLLCSTLNDRALALIDLGQCGAARRDFDRCLRSARRRGSRAMVQQVLMNVSEIDRREGRISKAVRGLERAVELARELDDVRAEASTLSNLGLALLHADRTADASVAYTRALRLARDLEDHHEESAALSGLAWIALASGRAKESVQLYRRSVARCDPNDHRHRCEHMAGLAEALATAGLDKELARVLQQLVDAAQSHRHDDVAVDALLRCGGHYIARRKRAQAVEYCATAVLMQLVAISRSRGGELTTRTAPDWARELGEPLISIVRMSEGLGSRAADQFHAAVVRRIAKRGSQVASFVRPLLGKVAATARAVALKQRRSNGRERHGKGRAPRT